MNKNLTFLTLKAELGQSDFFGYDYDQLFYEGENGTVTSSLVADVAELLNRILSDCDAITHFQSNMLENIFIAFNDIRQKIDPFRLASFNYAFNNDEELVLYRDSDIGLTNLIINPEECIAYSFISKKGNPAVLEFFDEEYSDFESLAYRFFSN